MTTHIDTHYKPNVVNAIGSLVNRLLRFVVDDITHLHQNRPKIDASDIAANTSVGSLFRSLPTT